MVGLVNAIGTSETSRVQAELSAASRNRETEQGKLLPLLDSVRAAEKVLEEAVRTIEFAGSESERSVPNGEESDRFDQADQEAKLTPPLGAHLDVTT